MTIAAQYAKALYMAASKNGERAKELIGNLRQALESRGHIKLLPQIFSEYKKLVGANERAELHKKITPETEQTRVLLELYGKLVNSK